MFDPVAFFPRSGLPYISPPGAMPFNEVPKRGTNKYQTKLGSSPGHSRRAICQCVDSRWTPFRPLSDLLPRGSGNRAVGEKTKHVQTIPSTGRTNLSSPGYALAQHARPFWGESLALFDLSEALLGRSTESWKKRPHTICRGIVENLCQGAAKDKQMYAPPSSPSLRTPIWIGLDFFLLWAVITRCRHARVRARAREHRMHGLKPSLEPAETAGRGLAPAPWVLSFGGANPFLQPIKRERSDELAWSPERGIARSVTAVVLPELNELTTT